MNIRPPPTHKDTYEWHCAPQANSHEKTNNLSLGKSSPEPGIGRQPSVGHLYAEARLGAAHPDAPPGVREGWEPGRILPHSSFMSSSAGPADAAGTQATGPAPGRLPKRARPPRVPGGSSSFLDRQGHRAGPCPAPPGPPARSALLWQRPRPRARPLGWGGTSAAQRLSSPASWPPPVPGGRPCPGCSLKTPGSRESLARDYWNTLALPRLQLPGRERAMRMRTPSSPRPIPVSAPSAPRTTPAQRLSESIS
jgi:hypothetical protein